MTSAFSWQISITFCPVSFCTPTSNLPVTSGISWLSIFAFQSPIMKRTYFLGCQFQKILYVFLEPFNFSFFSIIGQAIDLNYCDIVWFALQTNRDHSVIFETASKYCILDSFIDCDSLSISSKGFLLTVVDMVSHLSQIHTFQSILVH